MALPPERVSIKRKRDSESVDVLFLQDKKRPRFIFQKVSPNVSKNIFASPASTRPPTASHDTTSSKQGATTVASRPVSSSRDQQQLKKQRSELRQFRLDRPLGGGSRVQKSGRSVSPKKDVATFYETRLSRRDQAEKKQALETEVPSLDKSVLAPVKRLKPRASAAELKWREKAWGSASGSRSASRAPGPSADDPRELALAEQLSAFALEATKPAATPDVSKGAVESPVKPKPALKFQPKPAPPRGRNRNGMGSDGGSSIISAGGLNDTDGLESDSDYEYDTYIRVPVKQDPMDVDMSFDDPVFIGKALGVLVIEEEDEEAWAAYALDGDEEAEFDTDEEDENAEDYYGNDYPEDELDSDDEFNRGAYGYRYAGSEEEEFGDEDDEADWSDGETRLSRLPAPQLSESWANEFASPIQHRGQNPY